jgi:hypothetical protein
MENQQVVSLSRLCSSTPDGFGQGFLVKEQCDDIGASPYSPELAPADFYLFPRMKSVLKGRRFRDATDIIENAAEKLKIISQNGSQECISHLLIRCQMFSCIRGLIGIKM